MRIGCPLCGERDAQEFTYLGDARPKRPVPGGDAAADLSAMTEYAYSRENPAGPLREFWYHAAGCHAWLVVTRNTRTHEILAVETASARGQGEAA
jgi:heterotetrameric sarcosine oxidase delta subunit